MRQVSAPGLVTSLAVFFTGWVVTTPDAAAASRVAATCSSADVQAEINAAMTGDVVQLPAPCTATWNPNSINIPSSKGLTLDGRGAIITRGAGSDGSPMMTVNTGSAPTRVTALAISGSNVSNQGNFVSVYTDASGSDALFRIDHVTFDGDTVGIHVKVYGPGYGLIDHCSFAWDGNNEVIHALGYGPGSNTGWANSVFPGSQQALYVEDSTFLNRSAPYFLGGKTAAFYGARTVYRFNTFTRVVIDNHGTAGNRGARWWELYKNTFTLNAGDNVDKWIQNRAGSGLIFGNTVPASGNNGGGTLTLWEEDTGYPAQDQIGRGMNQTLDPAYIWLKPSNLPLAIDQASANQIVADRDYYLETASFNGTSGVGVGTRANRPATCTPAVAYWATDEGEWWAANAGADGRLYKCIAANTWALHYTPFTYPHPLQSQGGAVDRVAPSPPTNLQQM